MRIGAQGKLNRFIFHCQPHTESILNQKQKLGGQRAFSWNLGSGLSSSLWLLLPRRLREREKGRRWGWGLNLLVSRGGCDVGVRGQWPRINSLYMSRCRQHVVRVRSRTAELFASLGNTSDSSLLQKHSIPVLYKSKLREKCHPCSHSPQLGTLYLSLLG